MDQFDFVTLFAIGLAVRAFAMSMEGPIKALRHRQTLRPALAFGGPQGLMPVLPGKSIALNP